MMKEPNSHIVKETVSPMGVDSGEALRSSNPAGYKASQELLAETRSRHKNLIENKVPGSVDITRGRRVGEIEIRRRCKHCGR